MERREEEKLLCEVSQDFENRFACIGCLETAHINLSNYTLHSTALNNASHCDIAIKMLPNPSPISNIVVKGNILY